MNAESSEVRRARIAWRCRRGMRELDLLLANFLTSGLKTLKRADLDHLEHLLEQPDQDILAWLTGAAEPEDSGARQIVTILRAHIELPHGNERAPR